MSRATVRPAEPTCACEAGQQLASPLSFRPFARAETALLEKMLTDLDLSSRNGSQGAQFVPKLLREEVHSKCREDDLMVSAPALSLVGRNSAHLCQPLICSLRGPKAKEDMRHSSYVL